MICTKCGKERAEWEFGEESYCQMCWEAHCSEEWWRLSVWQIGYSLPEVQAGCAEGKIKRIDVEEYEAER